ncbi:MAG TPA: outer membrane protein assembly factor BamA [Bradyrhizobium sp.]|nr:outer membrane protein assembly factor BamA [Bradyrhizobium sp.]
MSKAGVVVRRRRSPVAGALFTAILVLTSSANGQTSAGGASDVSNQAQQGSNQPNRSNEKITVEGNRRIDADTVRSYFHPSSDGHFDAASLNAALKALVATNLFDDVKIEHAGDHLIVHVSEAKVIERVAFEGNKKVQDKELQPAIASKARGTLRRAMVQSDVNHIIEVYRHSGRDDVKVVPEIIDRGNDRVDLVYEITEGAKTTIRQVNFVGNHAFGKRQLSAVIRTSVTNILSFLIGGDVYDPDQIAADREALRTYYRSKGYADASVTSANAEYDPAEKGFNVTFTIDEGQLYHFGDINVVCNVPGVDPGKLRHVLLIKTGALFDGKALDKSTEVVGTELAKLGFPFAQATPHTIRDAQGRRINVSFEINQGPRTYVERIEIHGNTRTRDYVIRREFDFAEGDAYNKSLIDRAERRLKNLNYFKTVKITAKPGSASDRVVLDVDLVEEQTGDFNISGGYSTTDGFLAEVTVGDRNVLGTGRAVKATVTYGQYAEGADLSMSDPSLFGNRIQGGVDLFAKDTESSPYQSYGAESYGATFSLGLPINEQIGTQLRYSISRQDVTLDPSSLALPASLPIQYAAAAGPQWVSAVGDTISYNTLDNNKMPTSGVDSELKQDLAGLGGDVDFLRTTEDFRYYQSINSDLTAMVRAQGGYITGYGGQQVPLIDSFFGGPQMVRGFAPNGFGPRDLTPGTTMDNVGGSAYWATTAELQSGIPGVPDEYGLKASAFVDSGSVFHYAGPTTFPGSTQSMQLANNNVLRSSVGVGLTWGSPFGALTVDYAVPITKASYDVTQPINFTAGAF